jgi:hypothetical protein
MPGKSLKRDIPPHRPPITTQPTVDGFGGRKHNDAALEPSDRRRSANQPSAGRCLRGQRQPSALRWQRRMIGAALDLAMAGRSAHVFEFSSINSTIIEHGSSVQHGAVEVQAKERLSGTSATWPKSRSICAAQRSTLSAHARARDGALDRLHSIRQDSRYNEDIVETKFTIGLSCTRSKRRAPPKLICRASVGSGWISRRRLHAIDGLWADDFFCLRGPGARLPICQTCPEVLYEPTACRPKTRASLANHMDRHG